MFNIWGRVSSVDIIIRCGLSDTGPARPRYRTSKTTIQDQQDHDTGPARPRYLPPKSSDFFLEPTQSPVQLGNTVISSRVKTVLCAETTHLHLLSDEEGAKMYLHAAIYPYDLPVDNVLYRYLH